MPRLLIISVKRNVTHVTQEKRGNLHNGTSPLTVQLQYGTEKLYGKRNPNKLNRKHSSILRLYRFVAEPHNGTGVIKKIMYTYPRVN